MVGLAMPDLYLLQVGQSLGTGLPRESCVPGIGKVLGGRAGSTWAVAV